MAILKYLNLKKSLQRVHFTGLRGVLTILLVGIFLIPRSFAEIINASEAKAFSSFIESLILTAQTSKQGRVCFFGSDEISKILINNFPNPINLDRDPSKYESCKITYIALDKEKGFRQEINKFNQSKILTIAIFDGFTEKGGTIKVQMGRRDFELTINSEFVKASGVKLGAFESNLSIN